MLEVFMVLEMMVVEARAWFQNTEQPLASQIAK